MADLPVYIHRGILGDTALPPHPFRNQIVWDLVKHYALEALHQPKHGEDEDGEGSTPTDRPTVVIGEAPCYATLADMSAFHDTEYLQYLKGREEEQQDDGPQEGIEEELAVKRRRADDVVPLLENTTKKSPDPIAWCRERELPPCEEDVQWGLTDGCRPFRGLWRCIQATTGGTLRCVDALVNREARAAIHWWGGRHHARVAEASGFCFVNDIVLAALKLKDVFEDYVLVVDLDVHHGDGTAEGLMFDADVVTVSLHQYGPGLYPNTGDGTNFGAGWAAGTNIDVPLPPGGTDDHLLGLLQPLMEELTQAYTFGSVVIVLGTDALQGDPIGTLNASVEGLRTAVRVVLDALPGVPSLVLGAGGYVDTSTARVTALVTKDIVVASQSAAAAVAPHTTTSSEMYVPETCEFFSDYAKDIRMAALPPIRYPKAQPFTTDCISSIVARWHEELFPEGSGSSSSSTSE